MTQATPTSLTVTAPPHAQGMVDVVVMISDGDAPHDARYDDLLSAASPKIPRRPRAGIASMLRRARIRVEERRTERRHASKHDERLR